MKLSLKEMEDLQRLTPFSVLLVYPDGVDNVIFQLSERQFFNLSKKLLRGTRHDT